MTALRQLPLPFVHRPRFAPEGFVASPANEEALAWLDRTGDWPQGRLALYGPEGSGKTHLLHLWAQRHGAAVSAGTAPSGLPAGALAIDDADLAPERPLLHALNAAAEAGLPVLLAARAAPSRWKVALPDLGSRLRAMPTAELLPADEALLRRLLARLLAERQLAVAEPVQEWLLRRLPRTQAAMRETADALDRAALASGTRVTRALAAACLPALADHEDLTPEEAAASPGVPRLL